jgi:short-subunit dehydrogenase
MPLKPSVLITGAPTLIGAESAERFAQRGHELFLVNIGSVLALAPEYGAAGYGAATAMIPNFAPMHAAARYHHLAA